jgi:tetratricopeptide (TPR) repeat protein
VAQRLGSLELAATATLNIGLAHHLAGARTQAVAVYRESLAQARAINYVLVELRALSNLAEALAELGELETAHRYWLHALEIARREAFDDERVYLEELATRLGFAVDRTHTTSTQRETSQPSAAIQPAADLLSAQDALALDLARREGSVTPRRLMEVAHLSKATATRRLTALATAGLLTPVGRGRGISYVIGKRNNTLSAELCARYGIRAAGWVAGAPILALRFEPLPDLLTFLALRAEVRQEVGEAVEVLPVEALAANQVVMW